MQRRRLPIDLIFVDDEESVRMTMELLLPRRVESYRAAANGAEALSVFEERPGDVIVTDLRMPEMDGIALAREVRRKDRERGKRTFIIVTSAYRKEDIPELSEAGLFDAVIEKPLVPPRLFEVLERYSEGKM